MKRILMAIAALLAIVGASAQVIIRPRHTKPLGDVAASDSLDLHGILRSNAPEDHQVTLQPYLTIVGGNGRFVAGIGGFVKAVAGWDIGHPISSPDEFITSQIPVGDMDGDGSRFNLTARQTHLYANFVFLPSDTNQIGAFVGANFLNENYIPVLQYAFLRYRGFKAGYDNSLFSDPACGPPAVDYEGPCSNTANPVAGLSYRWQKGHCELAAGIELPQTSFTTTEGFTRSVYQRVPDIPLGFRYSWGGGNSWVRVSAIIRNMTYRSEQERKNHNVFGYGFQLSGAEKFCFDKLTFFWQGVWGKGIGSMIQDTAGEGLDLVPAAGDPDALKPVMVWGGFLSLQYNISSRFTCSTTYSQMRTYADRYEGGTTPRANQYKYAQYVSSNVFFSATSYLEIGLEHIWGRRVNYDGQQGDDNRIQVSAQLTF